MLNQTTWARLAQDCLLKTEAALQGLKPRSFLAPFHLSKWVKWAKGRDFFPQRIISLWNSLLQVVVKVIRIQSFKKGTEQFHVEGKLYSDY